MKRVVILGPGGAGKSTLARRLASLTALPLVELDKLFWQPGLVPLSPEAWRDAQQAVIAAETWILDGDLGPYDVLQPRLAAADTVVFLDISVWRSVLRALRRGGERLDFWLWLATYPWKSRPAILSAIKTFASDATLHVLRKPAEVERFFATLS